MDVDGRLREDIISPLLKVSTFKGFTLTGPREAIIRKVYSNQVVATNGGIGNTGADQTNQGSFTQLNFRCLGTSPTAMLNARVRLVVPLIFYCPNSADSALANVRGDGADSFDQIVVGPRRNGLLKAFSSISTVINNTTSFSVRPDESLAVAEQCFTQVRDIGMTGVNNGEESGWWGPDWDGSGQFALLQAATPAGNGAPLYPPGALCELGMWASEETETKGNRSAAERRSDFLSGIVTTGWDVGTIARKRCVKYEYRSDLYIPPFKCFDYPTVSKSPTYIPYADQIEVSVHWKSLDEIKAALLLGRGPRQGQRTLTSYGLAYYAQPYLECEYIVPNYSLPPVVTLPAWRTIHYQHDVKFDATTAGNDAAGRALREGTGVNKQSVTLAPIRIESLPSMVMVWVSDPAIKDSDRILGFNQREYFGLIDSFSVTLNEKLRVLSDRSPYDLYKLFRMYCPNSKMSYKVWRELRQVIVFRSDVLCTEASQSVFSPTTITFQMAVTRAIQNRDAGRSACTQRIHILFWYGNEALSMSSQSSAVTSLLLNPGDVKTVKVGVGASAITEIMARNQ